MFETIDVSSRIHGAEIFEVTDGLVGVAAVMYEGDLYAMTVDVFKDYAKGEVIEFDWTKKIFVGNDAILVQAPNGYVGVINEGVLRVYNTSLDLMAEHPIGLNKLVKVTINAKGEIVPGRVNTLERLEDGTTRSQTGQLVGEIFANNRPMQLLFGALSEDAPMPQAQAK